MTTYVALLRGINVGGKNIIKMEYLRTTFEQAGFASVKTYIQSGNVVFHSTETDSSVLAHKIQTILSKRFMYQAKVIIKSIKEMETIITHFPKIFDTDTRKHNVIFLSPTIDTPDIVHRFAPKKDIEELSYCAGALFRSAKMDEITHTTMLKLSRYKEYQEMTVRNITTTKKIVELMKIE